ncbi:hypothetical protein [Serratia sp. D1N4]
MMNSMTKTLTLSLFLAGSALMISAFSVQAKSGDNSYCNPNNHSCEAPFTLGKDKIAPPVKQNISYCDPNYHSCQAPFTLGQDKIAPSTGENNSYCNPNNHSCEAPFTLGKDHING